MCYPTIGAATNFSGDSSLEMLRVLLVSHPKLTDLIKMFTKKRLNPLGASKVIVGVVN